MESWRFLGPHLETHRFGEPKMPFLCCGLMKRTKGWLTTFVLWGEGWKVNNMEKQFQIFWRANSACRFWGNKLLLMNLLSVRTALFSTAPDRFLPSQNEADVSNWFQPAVAMVSMQEGTTEEKGECESCDVRDILMSCDLGYSLITRKLWWWREGYCLVLGILWQLHHEVPVLLGTFFFLWLLCVLLYWESWVLKEKCGTHKLVLAECCSWASTVILCWIFF